MRIISFVKDGKRIDMPIEKFQKMLEETKEKNQPKQKSDRDAV